MIYFKTLTFALLLFFLNSCGENSTTTITTDVIGMSIDQGSPSTVYSTDEFLPTATVYYMDGTQADATNNVGWKVSDTTILYISNDIKIIPYINEGNATLTAGYLKYEYFENNITVDIIGITDLNTSWRISSADINTTGDFDLSAEGNYTDGTNNKNILHNIIWTSTDTTAVITTNDDYSVKISIITIGDINITATLFGDVNTTMTKSYTIN